LRPPPFFLVSSFLISPFVFCLFHALLACKRRLAKQLFRWRVVWLMMNLAGHLCPFCAWWICGYLVWILPSLGPVFQDLFQFASWNWKTIMIHAHCQHGRFALICTLWLIHCQKTSLGRDLSYSIWDDFSWFNVG
jgi:hypothetical protein